MRVRYTARARADIQSIHTYIAERNPEGARNVARAIYSAIEFISEHPGGSEATDDPQVRIKTIVGYPYRIFYGISDDAVEILHVRHAARRPWKSRR